eukprot:gene8470-5946_t
MWYPQAAPTPSQWSPSATGYNPSASMNGYAAGLAGYNPGSTGYANLSMSHSMIPNTGVDALSGTQGQLRQSGTQAQDAEAPRHGQPQEVPQEMAIPFSDMTQLIMDPYVCGGPNRPGFLEFIYPFCDWTFLLTLIFFIMSIVGLGLILGNNKSDNLFNKFGVDNTDELQKKIESLITVTSGSCEEQYLFGSFGTVCMESTMNANTFAVQLSFWNNARGSLWCLAAFFSALALLFAIVIHVQRHPNPLQSLIMTPEMQAEFMSMTPAQQQLFTLQRQQQVLAQSAGCCGGNGIEVYDTPYYAFLRFAWGFVGITAFVWVATSLISFWSVIGFYISHSTGDLKNFFESYAVKYTATTITVFVYLCWPLLCLFLELVVWVVGFLPWLIIRTALKPGIERFRPSLPLSQIPGYIRCDMFFMDFQDIKRFGFSRLQWMLLTESERPFFDCFEDQTLVRDPATMNAMLCGLPPGMLAAAAKADPNAASDAQGTLQQRQKDHDDEKEGRSSSRRRRHRSKSRGGSRRHRSRKDPEDGGAGANAEEGGRRRRHRSDRDAESNGRRRRSRHRSSSADGEGQSRRKHRRRSAAEGGESRRRRSRKNTEEKPAPPPSELDALMNLHKQTKHEGMEVRHQYWRMLCCAPHKDLPSGGIGVSSSFSQSPPSPSLFNYLSYLHSPYLSVPFKQQQ